MKIKQIKIPKSGQPRGEGEWEDYTDFCKMANLNKEAADNYWKLLQKLQYIPTREIEDNVN